MSGEIVSTGDGLSLGVSLVLLEIPNDGWIKQSIITALDLLTIEDNWRAIGSNSPDLSARVFSLILQTLLFDYEPPAMTTVGITTVWFSDTIPVGWLKLDGSGISKTTYPLLFDIFGYAYGGGGDTFVIPTMASLIPMGVGGYISLGQLKGGTHHNIAVENLPPHTHPPLAPSTTFFGLKPASTNSGAAGTTYGTSATTGSTGDGVAMEIVSPVRGVHYIIFAG